MADRILIIHPSELIRNGIMAAFRELMDVDVSMISGENSNEISFYEDVRILMIDAFLHDKLDFLGQLKMSRSVSTVGIYYPDDWKRRRGIFDREIHTEMSIREILNCIMDLPDFPKDSVAPLAVDHHLTSREIQLLKLLAMGHSHKEIAEILHISIHTVISHRKNISSKLGIKSLSGLAVYSVISGLIDANVINPESLI